MASAPNCKKNSERARMRRAHHIEDNKKDAEWNKILDNNKYPKCFELKEKIYDNCPEKLDDPENPPSECRICPQFVPTKDMRKKHAMELMALMRKS